MEDDPADDEISEEAMERLNDPLLVRRHIEEGKTFQELIGYSSKKMENFYRTAKRLLDEKKVAEAKNGFIFLTSLNPYVYAYWMGLGFCEQLEEEEEQAIVSYSMALLCDNSDPWVHYHTASCYYRLGATHRALDCLEKAALLAEQSEDPAILSAIQRSRAALRSRRSGS